MGTLATHPSPVPVLADLDLLWQQLRCLWLGAPVVVELQDHALGLAQFQTGPQGPRLRHCCITPLPTGAVVAGVPRQPQAIGELLRDLLLDEAIPALGAIGVLPGPAHQLRLLELDSPDGGNPPWPSGADLLAWPGLTGDIPSELAIADLLPLAGPPLSARGREGSCALAAVTRRGSVDAWAATFDAAELELLQLDVSTTALLRLLADGPSDVAGQALVVLLDLQPDHSELLLLQQGLPCYRRLLGPLPGPLEQTIARELELQGDGLEQDEPDADAAEAADGLWESLGLVDSEALVRDLIRCVTFFQRQQGQGTAAPAPVARILLSGPGACFPQLSAQISQQCGWPTALLDPLASVAVLPEAGRLPLPAVGLTHLLGMALGVES